MLKSFFKSFSVLNFVVIMLLGSCTENPKTNEPADAKNTATDTLKKIGAQNIIGGNLNILWTDAATFTNSNRRIVFRFYANAPDTLTLHGWTNDNDNFPDPPDIKLKMATVSNMQYGNKTYFGNLVLTGGPNGDRKKINQQIVAGNFRYVLFLPHDPAKPNYPPVPPGQITYDIELTNTDPAPFIKDSSFNFVPTPTNLSLNPSPPRNPR